MANDFPSSPTNGQLFTSANGNVYYWDATKTAWRARPQSLAPATVGDAPPSNPVSGSLWYNSSDGNLYVYYSDVDSSQWVQIRTDMSFTSTIGPSVDSLNLRSPNYIINGAFDIWQRGTSFAFSNTVGGYCADRFAFYTDGTGSAVTVSQQTFTPGSAPVPGYEGRYFIRVQRTAAGTGNTYSNFQQPIEDVRTLAGQTATVSFWAKADSARTLGVQFAQSFGSGGSTAVWTTVGSASVTTGWQRFAFTFSVPSISGKTIGSDSYAMFVLNTGNAVSTFDFWGFQVEAGAQASSFRRNANSLQGELAACQRYCYQLWSGSTDFEMIVTRTSATLATGTVFLPVPMRTIPSLTATSSGGFYGRLVGRDTSFGLTTVGVTGIEAKSALPGTNALANANNSQIDIWFTHSTLAGTYVFVNFDTYSYSSPAWLTAEL